MVTLFSLRADWNLAFSFTYVAGWCSFQAAAVQQSTDLKDAARTGTTTLFGATNNFFSPSLSPAVSFSCRPLISILLLLQHHNGWHSTSTSIADCSFVVLLQIRVRVVLWFRFGFGFEFRFHFPSFPSFRSSFPSFRSVPSFPLYSITR